MARPWINVFLAGTSGMERGVMAGLGSFLGRRRQWRLNPYVWQAVERGENVSASSADAAFGRITREIAELWPGEARRRVVNVSRGWDVPGASNVTCDDRAIGRMGAEYLLGKGLEAFAWVGFAEPGRRFGQFAWTLERHGHRVERFDLSDREGVQAELAAWLRGLAVPTGLLAFNDDVAMVVLDCAAEAGVGIPDRLAVVGVDNDELRTLFAPVAVTSIDPDFVEVGRRAAETLDAVFKGGDPAAEPIRVPPKGVIERESTDFPGELDPVAVAAARLIRAQATEGINVGDVVDQLPASRRSAGRRFQKAFGRSIAEEITRVRLAEARRLLIESRLPLGEICRRVGYVSAAHFSRLFRKEVGCTPSAYRRGNRAG